MPSPWHHLREEDNRGTSIPSLYLRLILEKTHTKRQTALRADRPRPADRVWIRWKVIDRDRRTLIQPVRDSSLFRHRWLVYWHGAPRRGMRGDPDPICDSHAPPRASARSRLPRSRWSDR